MVSLSESDKARGRFHLLGTGAGVPAGDAARVEEALSEIPNTTAQGYVIELLDTCDSRWLDVMDGSAAIAVQLEEYAGDLNRTISRSQRNQQTIDLLYRAYYRSCEHLARILWCPIYTTPDSDVMRFARHGGEYVNSLPGRDGMPGFHLMYQWSQLTGFPPASKTIRANSADLQTATTLFVSETDRKNKDVSNILNFVGAGSVLQLSVPGSEDYATYTVTGASDSGAYRSLTVTWLQGSANTISDAVNVNLAFISIIPASVGDLVTENAQVGTAYTLVLSDQSKTVSMSNAAANVLTIPTNASVAYPVGALIYVYQGGAGQTTITPDTGVTLRSSVVPSGSSKLRVQYSWASLWKKGTNEWIASGDLIA
jgi:hypothetical protein